MFLSFCNFVIVALRRNPSVWDLLEFRFEGLHTDGFLIVDSILELQMAKNTYFPAPPGNTVFLGFCNFVLVALRRIPSVSSPSKCNSKRFHTDGFLIVNSILELQKLENTHLPAYPTGLKPSVPALAPPSPALRPRPLVNPSCNIRGLQVLVILEEGGQ